MTISFADFVQTPSYCPNSVVYNVTVNNSTTIPSFMSFNWTSIPYAIYVNSGNPFDASTPLYNITIYAYKLNSDGTYTNGTLIIPLELTTVNLDGPMPNSTLQSYNLSAG